MFYASGQSSPNDLSTILLKFVPQNPKSYFLCDLKPHAKFENPRTTPSGKKVTGGERKREKTQLIEATTLCLQHPRAAHTTCSNQ